MTNELLINSVSPVSRAESNRPSRPSRPSRPCRTSTSEWLVVLSTWSTLTMRYVRISSLAGVKRSARIGHHMLLMLAQDRASLASHVRFIEHGGAEGFAQYQQRFIDEGKSAPANPYRYSVYSRGVVLARMILSSQWPRVGRGLVSGRNGETCRDVG